MCWSGAVGQRMRSDYGVRGMGLVFRTHDPTYMSRRRRIGAVCRLLRGRRLPVRRKLTLAALVREHGDAGLGARALVLSWTLGSARGHANHEPGGGHQSWVGKTAKVVRVMSWGAGAGGWYRLWTGRDDSCRSERAVQCSDGCRAKAGATTGGAGGGGTLSRLSQRTGWGGRAEVRRGRWRWCFSKAWRKEARMGEARDPEEGNRKGGEGWAGRPPLYYFLRTPTDRPQGSARMPGSPARWSWRTGRIEDPAVSRPSLARRAAAALTAHQVQALCVWRVDSRGATCRHESVWIVAHRSVRACVRAWAALRCAAGWRRRGVQLQLQRACPAGPLETARCWAGGGGGGGGARWDE